MNKKWQDLSMLGAIIVAVGMPVQIASAQSGAETEDELIEEVVSVPVRNRDPRQTLRFQLTLSTRRSWISSRTAT